MVQGTNKILAEPGWFGPSERPLFGWLHKPAGDGARGAVVLCPPLGLELQQSQYCFGILAAMLAAEGFVVVRFDYDGTGDSAGSSSDRDGVARWLSSIDHAVELAKSTGADWLAGVGLRLGATLLTNARSAPTLDTLVLWDPCLSGRSFLRQQRTLFHSAATRHSGDAAGRVDIPGLSFSPETAAEVAHLTVPPATDLPSPLLLLTDPARHYPRTLEDLIKSPGVERQEYHDSVPVLDPSMPGYVAPHRTLDQMRSWVAEQCGAATTPVTRPPGLRTRAVVGRAPAGPVVEEVTNLGPLGLFGISTDASASDDRPVVLLLSNAANSRIGPMRQWVELARSWAGDFRSVRFDFSGIADSPVRAGQPEHTMYASEVLDDIVDVAHHVSPDDPSNVILVGLCSGAKAAMAVAPRLRPRAVVAVNPRLTGLAYAPAATAREREIALWPHPSAADTAPASRRAVSVARCRSYIGECLPPLAWSVATSLRLGHSPARFLKPLVRSEVPTLLICGEEEGHPAQERTPHLLRQLDESPFSRFELVPGLQHALFSESDRLTVQSLVTPYLERVANSRIDPAASAISRVRHQRPSSELSRSH